MLIGLSPYIVPADEKEPPIVQPLDEHLLEDYFKLCIDNGAKPVAVVLPIRQSLRRTYNANVVKTFRDTIKKLVKKYGTAFVDLLDDPCMDSRFLDRARFNPEDMGPSFVSAFIGSRLYLAKIISPESLLNMPAEFFGTLKKYYPNESKTLTQHVFCRMACDYYKQLAKILPQDECQDLMARVFCEMTYNHLAILSDMLPKDEYNDLAARIFKISAEKIRRKDKIKVGFYFENPSKWCGDDLYNCFARDERFESTVFFYPIGDELTRKEFNISLEKFKAHGLNVFEIKSWGADVPAQDVLITSLPYNNGARAFRLANLKLTTLMAYFDYGINVSKSSGFVDLDFYCVLWKIFFASIPEKEYRSNACKVGMPRGVYSGYPRMDIFFNPDVKFQFNWKMTRPDAKKIIWAPHHTVMQNISTFRFNHQFMYEFAKAHPEISWVVKPHPFLLSRAVSYGVFPSVEICKEYFQKWDDLPNAQVYMGPYYQAIFATSDGMIHDSDSFFAEYQYVNKPMIYLTSKNFTELGQKILEASYWVDGRKFDEVAAMIQRVFIDGDDYKAAKRKEVFDKYLNYPKANGMLASEFIYKNIKDELELKT